MMYRRSKTNNILSTIKNFKDNITEMLNDFYESIKDLKVQKWLSKIKRRKISH